MADIQPQQESCYVVGSISFRKATNQEKINVKKAYINGTTTYFLVVVHTTIY